MKTQTKQEIRWAMGMAKSQRDPNWDANFAEYRLAETARLEKRERLTNEIMDSEGCDRHTAAWAVRFSQWFIDKNARLERQEKLAAQIMDEQGLPMAAAMRYAGVWVTMMEDELSASGENK